MGGYQVMKRIKKEKPRPEIGSTEWAEHILEETAPEILEEMNATKKDPK